MVYTDCCPSEHCWTPTSDDVFYRFNADLGWYSGVQTTPVDNAGRCRTPTDELHRSYVKLWICHFTVKHRKSPTLVTSWPPLDHRWLPMEYSLDSLDQTVSLDQTGRKASLNRQGSVKRDGTGTDGQTVSRVQHVGIRYSLVGTPPVPLSRCTYPCTPLLYTCFRTSLGYGQHAKLHITATSGDCPWSNDGACPTVDRWLRSMSRV